ncbi:MAG: glycosyltransferase [Candidatus Thorarchaeota archaeon]|jgi:GT2 family glycosyltransferase
MSKRTSRRHRKARQRRGGQKGRKPVALIDITLPVYGEWALAEKALAAIPAAAEGVQGGYRVIVVDNGTPSFMMEDDQTLVEPAIQSEKVKEMLRPQDQFVRLDDNVGYPMGQNEAAKRGRSPLILIMTADVVLEPGAITAMVKEMDNPEVGVVGPLLVFPEESPHGPAGMVQHAGICFGIRGTPFHIFMGWNPDHPKVNQRRDKMLALTGACFMTRRNLWDALGGFQDVYGAGTFEDMDYCFGVRSLGGLVVFNPEARGTHFVGGSIKQGANQPGFPLNINSTIFKGRWAKLLAWDEWAYW